MGTGAMFSPPLVINSSLIRPVMYRKPTEHTHKRSLMLAIWAQVKELMPTVACVLQTTYNWMQRKRKLIKGVITRSQQKMKRLPKDQHYTCMITRKMLFPLQGVTWLYPGTEWNIKGAYLMSWVANLDHMFGQCLQSVTSPRHQWLLESSPLASGSPWRHGGLCSRSPRHH